MNWQATIRNQEQDIATLRARLETKDQQIEQLETALQDAGVTIPLANPLNTPVGQRNEAWAFEEAWRQAVRDIFGQDGYRQVGDRARALRCKCIDEFQAACEHEMVKGMTAMFCRKCGKGAMR
jgi:hypothetical protein